jgi:signal transduction histidine kinase
MDEWLFDVTHALRASLALASVEIFTGDVPALERVASDPYRARDGLPITEVEAIALRSAPCFGPAWVTVWLPSLGAARTHVAPLHHGDRLAGILVVRARRGGELPREASALIADTARRIAVVLENQRLDEALHASLEEVRASRARIAAAADSERRRIERDLHDGAQQHLVALGSRRNWPTPIRPRQRP